MKTLAFQQGVPLGLDLFGPAGRMSYNRGSLNTKGAGQTPPHDPRGRVRRARQILRDPPV